MRRIAAFAALFAIACGTALASDGQPATGGLLVSPDLNPPEMTEFVTRLKKAVADKNIAVVVAMVHYPLRCNGPKRHVRFYRTSRELRAHYARVFTPEVVASIASSVPGHLFSRDQGTMTDGGLVWMDDRDEGIRIFAVNHIH
ncbi:MAG: hypothetical protein ACRYG8_22670 [Janthinobacterium lividum]